MDNSRRGFLRMFGVGLAAPATVASAVVAAQEGPRVDMSPIARRAAKAAKLAAKKMMKADVANGVCSGWSIETINSNCLSITTDLESPNLTLHEDGDKIGLAIGHDGKLWIQQGGKWERVQTVKG